MKKYVHVGRFVNKVRSRIIHDRSGNFPTIYKRVKKRVPGSMKYVEEVVGSSANFIDDKIYTEYRNFRLLGSYKFKDNVKRPLNLYKQNYKTIHKLENVDNAVFVKTLVCITNLNLVELCLTVKPPLVFGRRARSRFHNRAKKKIKPVAGYSKIRTRAKEKISLVLTREISQKLRVFFNEKVIPNWPDTKSSSKVTIIKEYGEDFKTIVI